MHEVVPKYAQVVLADLATGEDRGDEEEAESFKREEEEMEEAEYSRRLSDLMER